MLIAWKNNPRHKPLLLLGARQVGKTWLAREFGRLHYKNVVYVRFDRDIAVQDYDIPRLLDIPLYAIAALPEEMQRFL